VTRRDADRGLHLPGLAVSGFRGISGLSVERLGRVTLFAGLNGAGKTTVLEAVQLYAGRGSAAVCELILAARSDMATVPDEEGAALLEIPDYRQLFGWATEPSESSAVIGPNGSAPSLRMEMRAFDDLPAVEGLLLPRQLSESDALALFVTIGEDHMVVPVPTPEAPMSYRYPRPRQLPDRRRAFETDAFPDAIKFLNKLAREGLYPEEALLWTKAEVDENWTAGNVIVHLGTGCDRGEPLGETGATKHTLPPWDTYAYSLWRTPWMACSWG